MTNTNPIPKNAFLPLDKEEAKLMNSIEKGKLKPVSKKKKKEILNIFSQAKIGGHIRTKPISLRLKEPTILKLKNQSSQSGVPYQTIISALADQYAAGKIKLGI